jgi:hypothetical protein
MYHGKQFYEITDTYENLELQITFQIKSLDVVILSICI